MSFSQLLSYFFTHKDYLPPANELPGTMFTPLHFAFAAVLLAIVIFSAIFVSKRNERTIQTVMCAVWLFVTVGEAIKIVWESTTGEVVALPLGSLLPLYPCSIFIYAMPLAIFGKGVVRKMGCGYVCTLGFLGGAINFVYPATVLGDYSCFSLAGLRISMSESCLMSPAQTSFSPVMSMITVLGVLQ